MKKNLFLRTDILPEEIPVLFSNKNVYLNFTEKKVNEIISDKGILSNSTIPFYFYIPKSDGSSRKMSLLHPFAQIQAFKYILRYEQLIISFCKNSPFSVRSPIRRNFPKIKDFELQKNMITKLDEEFSFTGKLTVSSDEDQLLFFNYFTYNKYKRITQLYESVKFNRDKYKYKYFLKLDIQRFFPSIYTHSLPWAIYGDKALAKKYKGNADTFASATDKVIQKINFNETHGLVTGPEFSRVISEILLTRIDINLHSFARSNNLENNRDYSLYRFIDDYFLFSLKKGTSELLEKHLRRELDKYNLTLNSEKTHIQKRPFQTSDQSIMKLRKILKEFELEKLVSSIEKNEEFHEFKGMKRQWSNLLFKIEILMSEYPESSDRIVNYFLKAIRNSIFYGGKPEHKYIIAQMLEVVSSVYALNISTKSTIFLLSIFIKLFQETQLSVSSNRLTITDTQEETALKQALLNTATFINEKIFQHLFTILKNNINQLENMYEILVFMKSLDKKLNASLLCKILDRYKESYFICCSVGYYILNEQFDGVDMRYLTVINKLKKIIFFKIKNYEPKGEKYTFLESDYFYLLNDFSFYPGFRPSDRIKLVKRIKDEKKSILQNYSNVKGEGFKNNQEEILELITRSSYYGWTTSADTFIRKIVKKSSNMSRIDSTGEY